MLFRTWRSLALAAGDTVALLASVAVASYVRLGDYGLTLLWTDNGPYKALLIVVICQICLHYGDLYDIRGVVDPRDLLLRLLQPLGVASLILAVLYFWFPDLIIGRG